MASQHAGAAIVEPFGNGWYLVRVETRQWLVAVAGPAEDRWVFVDGQTVHVPRAAGTDRPAGTRHRDTDVSAPMPATVVSLRVSPGQAVTAGETLVVLEAMKMELPIRAARDGVVKAVSCAVGDLVQPGISLVELM